MTRPDDNDLDDFGRQAGERLRAGAEGLDAATASRLNRARQAALATRPAARGPAAWGVPALSAAAVGALAVGLWLAREPDTATPPVAAAADPADLELLLAGDNLEMIEDLEFYAWLDADRSDAELRAELDAAG